MPFLPAVNLSHEAPVDPLFIARIFRVLNGEHPAGDGDICGQVGCRKPGMWLAGVAGKNEGISFPHEAVPIVWLTEGIWSW